MSGENITALAAYQKQRRNGHDPDVEPVPDHRLIKRMSDVSSRAPQWVWRGRLAVGYLTVMTGEEGLGKSVFNAWLAARVTQGELEGVWEETPAAVLIVASEDGLEDTWQPRLTLAGADMDRVVALSLDELPADWNVRDGIHDLRRAITSSGTKLVVFDALLDNMPPSTSGENINSATFVRAALAPLRQLVRELGIVALISLHPPKSRGFAFRDFVQGSQAFSAVSRLGLLFAWHPDDAEDDPDRRRVIVRGKGNLGRNPGGLEFHVVGRDHLHDDGTLQEREMVADVQPSDVTLRQLTAHPRGGREDTQSKTEQCADMLRDRLADGEWHASAPIRACLNAIDLNSDSVVDEAKHRAKVQSRKAPGNPDGEWQWRIPKNPNLPIDPETDSWHPKPSNPQYSREESNNPPPVTMDSFDPGQKDAVMHAGAANCNAPAWRLDPKGKWLCDSCFPHPPGSTEIEWDDSPTR